ncbi:prepilin peptidase [Piscicoccus intestinalis]|uniref:prepilin peptidase n=1 Tax=Piscicoccus intestinalis TaxID=746033 RepID=UPI000A01D3F7|nr:prepilin peptidase [Piscicoccus intestinalis]
MVTSLVLAGCGCVAGWVVRALVRRGRHRLPEETGAPTARALWVAPLLGAAWASLGSGGLGPALPAYLLASTVLAWLVAVDLDVRRLPNVVTLPVIPVSVAVFALLALSGRDPPAFARAMGGIVALSGLYAVLFAAGVAVGCRRGSGSAFGLGDVKLAAALGAWLAWPGWSTLLLGGYLGLLIGGLAALALLATGAAARGSHLPHAPAMALGAWLALCLT